LIKREISSIIISSGYTTGPGTNKRISQAWRQPVYRLLCGRLLFDGQADERASVRACVRAATIILNLDILLTC